MTKKPPKHVPKEASIRSGIKRKLEKLPDSHTRGLPGGMYARGLPDILLVYKGIPVLIEVKRPGGTPTKLQAMELMKFEKAGAVSLVMDSVKDVEPLVARLDEMVDRRDSSWRTHQIDWRREFNIKITI